MVDAFAVRSGEGEARWWLGALAVIKATAADTGGQLTVLEVTDPPGVEAPFHVHHKEDEAFWVLEGDVTFEVGEKRSRRVLATLSSARAMSHTATRSAAQAPGWSSCLPRAASRIWSGRQATRLPAARSPRLTIRCPTRNR